MFQISHMCMLWTPAFHHEHINLLLFLTLCLQLTMLYVSDHIFFIGKQQYAHCSLITVQKLDRHSLRMHHLAIVHR